MNQDMARQAGNVLLRLASGLLFDAV